MDIEIEDLQDSGVEPSVAKWFQPYEESFVRFARKHNLAVAKFLKDMPAWHFLFSHPCGGGGRIDMIQEGPNAFSITAHWYRDDYGEGTRSLKWIQIKDSIAPGELLEKVEGTLKTMLAWTPKDFEQTATGFKAMWQKTWTKEAFEKMASRYPRPRCE